MACQLLLADTMAGVSAMSLASEFILYLVWGWSIISWFRCQCQCQAGRVGCSVWGVGGVRGGKAMVMWRESAGHRIFVSPMSLFQERRTGKDRNAYDCRYLRTYALVVGVACGGKDRIILGIMSARPPPPPRPQAPAAAAYLFGQTMAAVGAGEYY